MRLCREQIRRSKPQLELNLATAVIDNKKCFYKYISDKRRVKENLPSLLDAGGNAVTKGEEKAEVLHAFCDPLVLMVPSPLRWKTGTGSRMKPTKPKGKWTVTCYATLTHTGLWGWTGYTQGC